MPEPTTLDSDQCHFFKIPPELRKIIYKMVFDDLNLERVRAPVDVDRDANFDEPVVLQYDDVAGGDEGDEAYARDGENEDEATAADPEEGDTAFEEDGEDGQDEDNQNTRTVILDPDDDEERYSSTQLTEPRLTYPPLLNTCRLILQEAAPHYKDRLDIIGAKCLRDATAVMREEKDYEDHLGSPTAMYIFSVVIKPKLCKASAYATEGYSLIIEERKRLRERIGQKIAGSKAVREIFDKAVIEFIGASEELLGTEAVLSILLK